MSNDCCKATFTPGTKPILLVLHHLGCIKNISEVEIGAQCLMLGFGGVKLGSDSKICFFQWLYLSQMTFDWLLTVHAESTWVRLSSAEIWTIKLFSHLGV